MRRLPFILVAFVVPAMSFVAIHPPYVLVLSVLGMLVAFFLLALSHVERPYATGTAAIAESPRARRKTWIFIGASVLLTLSVLTTHWPLRLSYALSQASLNRIARQVASGSKVPSPQSAGVFSVTGTNKDSGLICLWIDEEEGEPIGFIQGPPNQIKAHFADYEVIPLSNNWCLVNSL